MGPGGRRAGFSLVEVAIVLVITGILIAIASPFQRRAVDQARGAAARMSLHNVLLAELTWYAGHQTFTNDRDALLEIDPSLPLGDAGTPGSIYIATSSSTAARAICLFTEASAGAWYTLFYSTSSDETSDLASPNDCTRRMLGEQINGSERQQHAPPPADTSGPTVIPGHD